MALNKSFIKELQQEAKTTRAMLERVPDDKLSWKPHEKSMTLGRLASHVAEIPEWISSAVDLDELDFAKIDYKPKAVNTNQDLLKILDDAVSKATSSLENANDETFAQSWKLRNGDTVYVERQKPNVVRSVALSNLIHHRGQLSVYLRILEIPLPPVYGPTADEQIM